MSQELAVRGMTRREAEDAVREFHGIGWKARHLLLDMYERRAHTALGYGDDFDAFCRDMLGTDWKPDYLRQLRMWARVERDVLDISNTASTSLSVETGRQRLTAAAAFELSKLPSAERAPAYQELKTLGSFDVPQRALTDLKHIVTRRLNGGAPPAPTEGTTEQDQAAPPAVAPVEEDTAPDPPADEPEEEETPPVVAPAPPAPVVAPPEPMQEEKAPPVPEPASAPTEPDLDLAEELSTAQAECRNLRNQLEQFSTCVVLDAEHDRRLDSLVEFLQGKSDEDVTRSKVTHRALDLLDREARRKR